MPKRVRAEEAPVAAAQPAETAAQPEKKLKTNATLQDKIIAAIRTLKSTTGSSAQAIQKMILTFNGSPTAFKNALKKAVEKDILVKNKGSYLVVGDPIYEDVTEKVSIEDIVLGDEGEKVTSGDAVVISYIGTLQETGRRFDTGKAFSFTIGAGDVIKGMDKGMRGMRVGGRRMLTIPSSLGYGKRGSMPDIPPNANLCFDIKLKKIR
jgi:FKBP-type peptidyl-prolyl cis-trans isomerase